MALDGAFLYKLSKEITEKAMDARVDKIYQPAKEELVLLVRSRSFNGKLFLSARGTGARIHFTAMAPENPATPPMFCMLLRKYLVGARLVSITQPGLERVLKLHFDAVNEFGDRISPSLIIEIMGSRSNLIFTDNDGRIIDAVKRSDLENSSSRIIQPGAMYELPAKRDKINLLESSADEVIAKLKTGQDAELPDALMQALDGTSPIVCRELGFKTAKSEQLRVSEMKEDNFERLKFYLTWLSREISGGGVPTLISHPSGKPLDYTYIAVAQYGMAAVTRSEQSYSELLDTFYARREMSERIHAHAQSVLKLLTTTTARISRKINAQKADLLKCKDRETLRIYGELLKANLHAVPKGASYIDVQNYYDPQLQNIRIPLNSAIGPAAQAQKYFKDYKKTYTAEQTLSGLIEESERELVYLYSVFDALTRAGSVEELGDIKDELEAEGYLRSSKGNGKKKPSSGKKKSGFLKFTSSDGFHIFVGRNNRQNDELTLHTASKDDIWLHVKDIPGSHVIIAADGKEVPERAVAEAAMLAAFHSKAKDSSSVPVDYCQVRRVKKPAKAKPGMVIYEGNSTIYVTPDPELIAKLNNEA